MDFDFRAGNTPLHARQNAIIYVVVLVAAIIAGLFFVVWFLLKLYKQKKETPEYIEKEKNRKTNKNDIDIFAKKNNLSKNFSALLLKICKFHEVPNILYSIKEFEPIAQIIDNYYIEQKNNISAQEINTLFNLKYRLERIYAASNNISNTYGLPAKTPIWQIFQDGSKAAYTIYKNQKDFLAIELPESAQKENNPEALSKIAFTFTSETGMSYAFLSRIMRYEQSPEGKQLMIVSHSNNLITKQQRHYKRIYLNEKTTFSSVKKQTGKKNNKYIPSESKYNCVMTNISGGGCCISSTLPIKSGQLVSIDLPFADTNNNCIGKIINTRKSKSPGIYNLHIQFIDLPVEVQNTILVRVNNLSNFNL